MFETIGKIKFKYVLFTVPLLFFLITFIFLGWVYQLSKDLPSLDQLETYDPNLSTRIYSADGALIREVFEEKRVLIPLRELSPNLISTVLATEDRRFYTHWGVDIIRFIKSALVNIREMRYAEGFSSITQQLARNLYHTRRKNLARKIKEVLTAIQIERTYSKDEILEMYLNTVSFGHRVHGIHEAARIFFSKHPNALTLEESALLIAQLKGPTRYSPVRNPDRALRRRNLILRNMLKFNYVNAEQYNKAVKTPVKHTLDSRTEKESWGIAPYFTEYVRLKLLDMQEGLGIDVKRDGLRVHTTLNSELQRIAEEESEKQLAEVQKNIVLFYRKDEFFKELFTEEEVEEEVHLNWATADSTRDSLILSRAPAQTAFIAMDAHTGHILALIGGRDIIESQFNRAVQAPRQPGSAFKPFIYTAAMEMGIPVTTQFLNTPVNIPNEEGESWTPANFDDKYANESLTLRFGLTKSVNIITLRLLLDYVKPGPAVQVAKRMGITSPLRRVYSLAMGTSEVYLKDIVAAYTAFANEGKRAEPISITKIEDRFGNVLFENLPKNTQVIQRDVAFMINSLLQSVVKNGTGQMTHSVYGFRRPAAGKTGTTDDNRNAWFIGYTPQLVAGTWVGIDDFRFTLGGKTSTTREMSGAIAALPIWAQFMKRAVKYLELPEEEFVKPPEIVDIDVCSESHMPATRYCKDTYKEVFIRRFVPRKKCDVHSNLNAF